MVLPVARRCKLLQCPRGAPLAIPENASTRTTRRSAHRFACGSIALVEILHWNNPTQNVLHRFQMESEP
jgi:hypothetical protein